MDFRSLNFCDCSSGLEGHQLLSRPVVDLDGLGLAARRIRPQPADIPHDQTPAAYDLCPTVASFGRAHKNVLARNAGVFSKHFQPHICPITHKASSTNTHKTIPVLDRLHLDSSCLAPACIVYALRPLRDLAHGRTGNVSWSRSLVLVARYSAVAKRINLAAMVDPLIPLLGDSSV